MILWPGFSSKEKSGMFSQKKLNKKRERQITRVGAALYLRCLINQVERTRHTAFPCGLATKKRVWFVQHSFLWLQVFMPIHPPVVIQGHNKRVTPWALCLFPTDFQPPINPTLLVLSSFYNFLLCCRRRARPWSNDLTSSYSTSK